jgi:hypothetical protein
LQAEGKKQIKAPQKSPLKDRKVTKITLKVLKTESKWH